MTIDSEFPHAWFRSTSPYINTHRGRTFVVWFGGDILESPSFEKLVHDLTLLSHLGVRLVLVHGMRAQIDTELNTSGIKARFEGRVRVTSNDNLPALQAALGKSRARIESAFSAGLPNTPMSGAQLNLLSGNLVIARPYGVRNSIDYGHTGEVRRIRRDAITQLLNLGSIVLLSPVGYSRTGEMFNLHAEEIASRTAVALKADKLIYLHAKVPEKGSSTTASEMTATQVRSMHPESWSTDLRPIVHLIDLGAKACTDGVIRCHLVNSDIDGALLTELFTRDGSGIMIDNGHYDAIRPATQRDVKGIYQLILPLVEQGILLPRTQQDLERQISEFFVSEREGSVIACASLTPVDSDAELGCLAVSPDFQDSGKATELLKRMISEAKNHGCNYLFALTTRSGDWFREHEFEPVSEKQLPAQRRCAVLARGSKVFRLNLH